MSASALVLAAGEGRRFGGAKQLALVEGRPMLDRVVDAAVAAVGRVVVVLGAHDVPVRDGVEVVRCSDWAEGQAASLRAGVAALSGCSPVVVLLADMPFVTPEVIAGALDQLTARHDVVRTTAGGRPTHPVVLGPRALAGVPSLRGDVGARVLFDTLRVCEWEAGHLFDATDVDTPEQLQSIAARVRTT
jgi:CTP:molybdopterin cytidylyltransferase MocA